MIRAQRASAKAHVYSPGVQVKVSTRVLPIRAGSSQLNKLLQSWIGPLRVEGVPHPGVVKLKLPDQYSSTSDTFSVHDVRPWLSHESHTFDPNLPPVQVHSAHSSVVQVIERKRLGRGPSDPTDLLDIPAQYYCRLSNGEFKWVHHTHFLTADERALLRNFEATFKRTPELPCNPTSDHPAVAKTDEGYHYKNVRGPKQHPKYIGAHFGVRAWDLGVRLGLFGDRFGTG